MDPERNDLSVSDTYSGFFENELVSSGIEYCLGRDVPSSATFPRGLLSL